MDAIAQLKDRDSLYDQGSAWRSVMMVLAPVVRPVREEIGRTLVDGARRARSLFDATGIIANNNLGSAVYGSASNPADKWFEIGTGDEDFDKWPQVKDYLAALSRRTFASYNPSWSAFYAQSFPLYLDVTGLGMGYFYQAMRHDRNGVVDGFTDKCIPLSEGEFRIDDEGRVTHFYRRFRLTLQEADKLAQERGGTLSEDSLKKLKEKPFDEIEIQHSVFPNDKYTPDRFGAEGMRFASCYVEVQKKFEMTRKGFEDMPYTVPAWERAAGESRGRGAGEMALSDILSLQVMQKSNLMGGEWAANPAWGMPHESNINLSRLRPGAIVPGAITAGQGNQLVKRLIENGSPPFSLEITNQLRAAIREAFEGALITVVQPGRTGVSDEETLDLREERFRRMAPYHGNITAFHLDQHVRRRFGLLQSQGIFHNLTVPKALQGRQLQPKFVSPMAMAQEAARGASAIRAANALAQGAQIDPAIGDRFNGDNFAKTIGRAFRVPEIINDDDATQQRRTSRMQAQSAAMTAQVADTGAGAAKKAAEASAATRAPLPGA